MERLLQVVVEFHYSNLRFKLMKGWIIVIALLLSACGGKDLNALNMGDVIVAFGDSLTAGYGVSEDKAYPAVLSELTGFEVINAGISGETTEEGLQRLESVLDKENPALLILFEGGNDILQNKSLDQAKANLDAMISIAKEKNIQVVLVGVPLKQVFSSTAAFYNELSEEHDLPIEAKVVASLLRKPAMKSDSVHFNVAGYRELATAIAAMLREAGALD